MIIELTACRKAVATTATLILLNDLFFDLSAHSLLSLKIMLVVIRFFIKVIKNKLKRRVVLCQNPVRLPVIKLNFFNVTL